MSADMSALLESRGAHELAKASPPSPCAQAMAKRQGLACVACLLAAAMYRGADACTNLIVTPGASVDGSTIYAYSADSAALYGTLDRMPGRSNISAGTRKKIFDWDSGVLLGEIEEVETTFDVVGNMNEFQLTIGETTFGGVAELTQGQSGAIMDYGSLIWTTLQRAKTVPEAITIMVCACMRAYIRTRIRAHLHNTNTHAQHKHPGRPRR